MAATPGRAGRLLVAAVVVIVVVGGAVVGVRYWWTSSIRDRLAAGCAVGRYKIDTGQAAVAASLVATVVTRALPARASTLLITAALQESKLRNIASGAGDRDSVGVLQQRPSQGWGTVQQLSDPTYAAGAFLDRLLQVPNWDTASAADAIQAVQVSVDGTLYAEHEDEATRLADALDGAAPTGLSCRFAASTEIASAQAVATQLQAALPVAAPAVDGQQIDVPGAGATTAAWLVANADRLGIAAVGYAGNRWTRTDAWTSGSPTQAPPDRVLATMAGNPTR